MCAGVCLNIQNFLKHRTRGEKVNFTMNSVVEMQNAVIVQDILITERTDVLSYYAQKKKVHRNVCYPSPL